MALTPKQQLEIKQYLVSKIREKLAHYHPETQAMPFHIRLLGRDKMALFSFIHSVNTSLGTSVFEKIAKLIVQDSALVAADRYPLEGFVSSEAVLKIDSIIRDLRSARKKPNSRNEVREIIKVARKGDLKDKLRKQVDLFFVKEDETEYYFEIKTAKPNIDNFVVIKRQLLEWVAMRVSTHPNVKMHTYLAIPYNPYEPEPYERWTLSGLFDLKNEILVGKEFWDFLGGECTYESLLEVFEKAGLEVREEIDQKIAQINEK